MTTPTSARDARAPTPPARDADHPGDAGMRDLLRDTALLATSLAPGSAVNEAVPFRERCRQVIDRFADALARRGYPDDVRHEALVAQCGLLDETALRYLDEAGRAGWELTPLQVERFNLHDAGERVIDAIEARVAERSPNADLLEYYAAILGIGFIGRHARDGAARRAALMAALHARLATLRPAAAPSFVADRPGRRLADWFHRLSPWAVAALACLAAALLWGMWGATLDAQLAHIVPAKAVQP